MTVLSTLWRLWIATVSRPALNMQKLQQPLQALAVEQHGIDTACAPVQLERLSQRAGLDPPDRHVGMQHSDAEAHELVVVDQQQLARRGGEASATEGLLASRSVVVRVWPKLIVISIRCPQTLSECGSTGLAGRRTELDVRSWAQVAHYKN